uniref:Protein FLX-like 2 n=1 Tax=Ananas comosus var. bracteatus TaxID=296719 RepID=A0A6V7PZP5_ANACO|nr:unnamed protein product [Ananas comosus var. bracteatus]
MYVYFARSMSLRGHMPPPLEGRPIQAPGMMRHGPFPSIASANHLHPLDPVPPPPLLAASPTILEEKVAVQEAEMERLAIENQRLAASHVTLRQELVATEREMQILQAQMASIHTESDIQIRALLEKIGKMEVNIRAGDLLEKELRQVHMEAQALFSAREELTAEIRQVTEELQKASTERRNLPEMCTELDALRQEHQKLRTAFEYEKGSNIKQVERMQAMENNLISMAREVEKLRVEVLNAEKRAQGPNPYRGAFTTPGLAHPAIGQGSGHPNNAFVQSGGNNAGVSYGHSGNYSASTFVSGGPPSYADAYGISQNLASSGATAEGTNIYSGLTAAVYSDGYGRQTIPVINATTAGEGLNPYNSTNVPTSYDLTRGAPSSTNG